LFGEKSQLREDFSSFGPPQSFLREASALIPRIEKDQRSSAAANIAGQQARIGDLEGALVTVQRAGSPSAQVSATASIAYTLASQGDLPLALEVIQNSSTGEIRRRRTITFPLRDGSPNITTSSTLWNWRASSNRRSLFWADELSGRHLAPDSGRTI